MTAKKIREIASYDPSTGVFTAMVSRPPCRVGDQIGAPGTGGYVQATIFGETYLLHRLAWLYMTGEWPADQIDHHNRNRGDNRWDNLRPATNGQNGIASGATWGALGIRGVYLTTKNGKTRYRAVLARTHIGYFRTPEEARAAYVRAAQKSYGEFAEHLSPSLAPVGA